MNMHTYLSHHQTPPPKSSCRHQNVFSNTSAAETPKDDLRRHSRARSGADSSSSSDSDVCLKKKRDEVQEAVEGTPSDSDRGGSRPYGKISVVGRGREMEDFVAVELGFLKRGGESYDFFGVFDGRAGRRVAQACGLVLHKMLAEIVEEESEKEVDWEAAMAAGFRMMEKEVNKDAAAAVVAVVGENEVVVANCGGTRAVVSSGGRVVQLEDHKPAKPEELEGVEDTIALEPKVRVMRRSHGDEFLILGSHGLWDVISDEFACQVTRRLCYGAGKRSGEGGGNGGTAAAALMAELTVARGSRDNISIIVVDLKGMLENTIALAEFGDR